MTSLDHVNKIDEYIHKCILKEELQDRDLVQIVERINSFLNLKPIQKYADDNNITYNGAKNNRLVIILLGHKFIIDND